MLEPGCWVTMSIVGIFLSGAVTLTASISGPPLYDSQAGVKPSKARKLGLAFEEQPANNATRLADTRTAFSFDTSLLSKGFYKFTRRSALESLAWLGQHARLTEAIYGVSFRSLRAPLSDQDSRWRGLHRRNLA